MFFWCMYTIWLDSFLEEGNDRQAGEEESGEMMEERRSTWGEFRGEKNGEEVLTTLAMMLVRHPKALSKEER